MSAPPSIRLSDAALSSAPPPAAAASSFLPIFFHDVAPDTDISALLSAWEGQFSLMSETAGDAVALFNTPRARDEARDRLGGGVRGRFTVTVPPAVEEAPQSKPAAARPKADA